MRTLTFGVSTGDRLVTDVTGRAAAFATDVGGDGLLHVFAPHATAGLALLETGSGTETDLDTVLRDLLPADDRYVHRHGSPGHGRDHVLPTFVAPSLIVPVVGGSLALGTWQSIVLVDPNGDNVERTIRLSFVRG
ncbi:MAG TPA: YjbQ family protein [Actinomycetota bacterium]|nr:YjbQ family protein [Actinomycetota bacterium]